MLTNFFLKMLNREAASPRRGAQRIIESLHLYEGEKIVDIGSGGGFFTLAFAKRVGENGTVYAVDTRLEYLEFVKRQAEKAGLDNVITALVEKDDVPLPEGALDLIFARDVFHHLPDPERYFRVLKRTLKPNGIVVIIDHAPARGFSFVSLFKHFTSLEIIQKTMEMAGYELSESFDFLLPEQTFTLWRRYDLMPEPSEQ
ncbi:MULTISPECIES: class I SAM-dependent methyltransferase [Aminobacterium]|jgi:ubiquinone/menaquinone biosynthesis C-methylase UbiE|uniref:class I SAM-dependent methyltransferase n=1 Tax=Aminobacterium TaxID=81466 RepID=UPI002580CCDA|nr:class I SAM-dependent methyltransferase [Aminobacterium sp. UBA4987]